MLKEKNKQIITLVLCCVILITSSLSVFGASIIILPNRDFEISLREFSDVTLAHWFYDDVMIMARRGYIQGTTEPVDGIGIFEPNGNVTLGQFLAIATRIMIGDKNDKSSESHWAKKYYDIAISEGLISAADFLGDASSLDTPLTREDMAYILVNIAKKRGESLKLLEGIDNNITDLSNVSDKRRDAVKLAYSSGLLTGKDNYEFRPMELLTRAETATVFCRVLNFRERPKVTVVSKEEVEYAKYVVRGEGRTQGLLRAEYARQFDIQALNNVRVGEDEKGVYLEFTAPVLPDLLKKDFEFTVGADVYEPNAEVPTGFVMSLVESGEYFKGYFIDVEENYIRKERIKSANVTVSVRHKTLCDSMLGHTVYIYSKTQALEGWYDNNHNSIIEYDSTHIFAGIGR